MSSDFKQNDFQDPKPFNTVSLINQRNHVKFLIDNALSAQAFIEMCTLVCEFELSPKDKVMQQIKQELKKNKARSYLPSAEDIEYYDKINIYMNATYCRGFKAPMGEDFFDELEKEEGEVK